MIVDLALAFLAGLLSFASTCVLPLVPAYVAYMGAAATGTETTLRHRLASLRRPDSRCHPAPRRQQRDRRPGRAAVGGLFRRARPPVPDRRRPVRDAESAARPGARRLRRPQRGRRRLPYRHGSADLLQPADGLQRFLPRRRGYHAV